MNGYKLKSSMSKRKDYLLDSAAYFEIFCRGGENKNLISKKLFRCVIKEAPDSLLKALSEAAFNLFENNIIFVEEEEDLELFRKYHQFFHQLAKKENRLRKKRNLLSKHPKANLLIGRLADLSLPIISSMKN